MKFVEEILSLNRAIRYCGIINKEGKVLAGSLRKGVESLEPSSMNPKLITQLAILIGADKGWDAYLGETDYFLIHKSKIDLLLFPIKGSNGVLVTTEVPLPTAKLSAIRKAIVQYESA